MSVAQEALDAGRADMAARVEKVWERNGGWIPGGAIDELSAVLGIKLRSPRTIMDERHNARTCDHPDCK